MDVEKPPPRPSPSGPPPYGPSPEGCLVRVIRLPVRIVVLVLVLPVRMLWDALVVGGRVVRDTVLRPLGRAAAVLGWALFVWPWTALWRYVVVPVGRVLGLLGRLLVVVPLAWLHRRVLTPLGRALAWAGRGVATALAWLYAQVLTPVGHALAWLFRGIGLVLAAVAAGVYAGLAWLVGRLVVVPARWLYRWVLVPVGRAAAGCGRAIVRCGRGLWWLGTAAAKGAGFVLYWIVRVLLVLPASAVCRWVLVPVARALAVVAREVGEALGHAWRVAGRISLAVGRLLGTFFRWILVEPVRWVYRTVLTPVGHVVRDTVLRPAAEAARAVGRATGQALAAARRTVRQARADVRRALFGEPRRPRPAARREPLARETRTLGSSTTALTKD
ncbi:hypothetical protein ABZT08_01820 [Streptomyces sp. NPDC005526]|uniref:hypothetical protein n=1 Tax=Streptomyces sp. NPDC005526 TaxID=3156885 RepID=UPI0033B5EA9B